MTDPKELDRLDRLMAEAMGWKRRQPPAGVYYAGDYYTLPGGGDRFGFSPTRNADDRDAVDDWVVGKGCWTEFFCSRLVGASFLYRINWEKGFVVGKAHTRGEAVCRAVEKMMEEKKP